MIRFFNVYYPTRAVVLLLCEAMLVAGCFLLSTLLVLGPPDAYIALFYEHGLAKVSGIAVVTLMLSYYFDLYEPQLVSLPFEVSLRLLFVIGLDCFALSAVMYFYPDMGIARWVYALGFAFLAPVLMFWRRAYKWILTKKLFRERVFVLGAGA